MISKRISVPSRNKLMVAVSSIDVVLFYFFKFIVSFKFNFVITRMIGAS